MNHYYSCKDTFELVSRFEHMERRGEKISLLEEDYLRLLSFYREEGAFPKALSIVNQALSSFKFSPLLHTQKAILLIESQKEEMALESLDRAEIFGQHFVETDLLRALVYINLKDYDTAFDILTELKLKYHLSKSETSRLYVLEALIYERQEAFERMYFTLREALKINPFCQDALEKIWLAVELTKCHAEAIPLYEAIIDENPYCFQAWYNMGHAQYFLCEYEKAIDAFEYTFIINDRFEPAYKDYAEVCFHLGDYEGGRRVLEEALDRFIVDEELLLKIAEANLHLGNVKRAEAYLLRAMQMNDKEDEIYFQLARCKVIKKDYSAAVELLQQAIEMDDTREDYVIELAKAYCELGQYQKALPLYKQATELGPELSENWVIYARFLLTLDATEEALELLEEAEHYSVGGDILYCKSLILFQQQNHYQAMEVLGEALEQHFKQHEVLFEWAPQLQQDTKVQAAIRYYAKETESI